MQIKHLAALAATTSLALGATACGSDNGSTTSQASGTATPAKPLAQIDSLSGRDTAVTLDGGFVSALKSLKLTPAPVGSAQISNAGVASFPITGGNVKYYKPGTVSPVRAGRDRP